MRAVLARRRPGPGLQGRLGPAQRVGRLLDCCDIARELVAIRSRDPTGVGVVSADDVISL
jgi:hypothetical protein